MGHYIPKAIVITAFEILDFNPVRNDDGSVHLVLDNGSNYTITKEQCGTHTPAIGDFLIFHSPIDIYLCPKHVFDHKYQEDTGNNPDNNEGEKN